MSVILQSKRTSVLLNRGASELGIVKISTSVMLYVCGAEVILEYMNS